MVRELASSEFQASIERADDLERLCLGTDTSVLVLAGNWITAAPNDGGPLAVIARYACLLSLVLLRCPKSATGSAEVRRLARAGLLYIAEQNDIRADSADVESIEDDIWVAREMLRRITEFGIAVSLDLDDDESDEIRRRMKAAIPQPDAAGTTGSWIAARWYEAERLRHIPEFATLAWLYQESQNLVGEDAELSAAIQYLASAQRFLPTTLGPISLLEDKAVLLSSLRQRGELATRTLERLHNVEHRWPSTRDLTFAEGDCLVPLPPPVALDLSLLPSDLVGGRSDSKVAIVTNVTSVPTLLMASVLAVEDIRRLSQEMKAKRPLVGSFVRIEGLRGTFRVEHYGLQDSFETITLTGRPTSVGNPGLKIRRHASATLLAEMRQVKAEKATGDAYQVRDHPFGASIAPLDQLLEPTAPLPIQRLEPSVLIIGDVAKLRVAAQALRVAGGRLDELIPIGSLSGPLNFTPSPWSNSLRGTGDVAIAVTHSLSNAIGWLETLPADKRPIVLMDARGHVARQLAPISRLAKLAKPLIPVIPCHDEEACEHFERLGYSLAQWPDESISLVVDSSPARNLQGSPVLQQIEAPLAALARKAIRTSAASLSGEAALVSAHLQLLRAVGSCFDNNDDEAVVIRMAASRLRFSLLGCPCPLRDNPPVASNILSALGTLERFDSSEMYGTPLRAAVHDLVTHGRRLSGELQLTSSKASVLSSLLSTSPCSTIVVDDCVASSELHHWLQRLAPKSNMVPFDTAAREFHDCMIVTSWLGRRRMSRLLTPPRANDVRLVLYNSEQETYTRQNEGWSRARQKRSSSVVPLSSQLAAATNQPTFKHEGEDDTLHEQLIADRLKSIQRQSTTAGRTDEMESARLLVFADGSYAWLTEDYPAAVATGLINGESSAKIHEVNASELVEGEYILFRQSHDSLAIRAAADELLGVRASHCRRMANLWRVALKDHVQRHVVDVGTLTAQLATQGLQRQTNTVDHWLTSDWTIAPMDGRGINGQGGDDLRNDSLSVIAAVTAHPQLLEHLDECRTCISQIRGAHLRASAELSRRIYEQLQSDGRQNLATLAGRGRLDFDQNLTIVRVDSVDDTYTMVSSRAVNRRIQETPL